MEDFERMQYREHQRQKLLEELKPLVWGQMSEDDIVNERFNENCFYWGLIASATGYAHTLRLEFEEQVGNIFYSSALNLFKNSVAPKIESFTPVREERQLIAVEFLTFVIEEMSRPIHAEILRLSVPPARDKFLAQVGLDQMQEIG